MYSEMQNLNSTGFGKCIHPCDLHLSQKHSQHFQNVPLFPFPFNPPSKDRSIGAQYDSAQGNHFLIQEASSQDKFKEERGKLNIFQTILKNINF